MRVKKSSALLWTAQALLAALFIFAGGMKLTMPAAALQAVATLPVPFLRFIGVMEVLGAIGLVLPGVLRIRRELTPFAGMGLMLIMTGATVITLEGGQVGPALVPFVVGLVAVSVVVGRRGWLPASSWISLRSIGRATTPSADESARRVA